MAYRSDRNFQLVGDLDLSRRGVEYGPLTCPIVTREMGPVLYVDYADTETLKAKEYRDTDREQIVDVDIVWGAERLADRGPFYYAVASHVIEHIPDPIGWLKEITDALSDDGRIALAIPDKRYTFDVNRQLSTTGELVEAYLEKHKRPSIKQVFDNCQLAVEIDVHDAWAGQTVAPAMMGDIALRLAFDQAVAQLSNAQYIDSHCWTFTPMSFLDVCEDLFRLQILPLEIDRFIPTAPGTFEFIVRFRRAGPDPVYTVQCAREIVRLEQAGAA